jgi:hypothetical protein
VGKILFRNRLDTDLPTMAWEQVSYTGVVPNWLAQRRMLTDPVTGQWFTYSGIAGETSGIYSTDEIFGNVSTLVCTHGGGTSTPTSSGCAEDGSSWTPNGPGPSDRHPEFQSVVDTTRNVKAQWSGLACGFAPADFWDYSLNATIANNEPALISTTGLTSPADTYIGGSLVYVPTDDVYWIRFSNGTTAVMARTASISSNQSAWGCVTQNAWAVITPTGTPTYAQLQAYEWDPVTERIIQLGVNWTSAAAIEVWSYAGLTQTWTNKSPSGAFTKQAADLGHSWLLSRITSGTWSGGFLIVRNGTGSTAQTDQAATYLYDSGMNTILRLETTGTGPSRHLMTTFVPSLGSQGGLVAHEGVGGQSGQFWHGVLS